jgi:hypothetical protein
MDALLEDALLETVMRSDVFLAIRTDSPAGGGRGTADDPYDASFISGGGGTSKFDAIMADPTKIPSNTTVRLAPGTYVTKGDTGWKPRSFIRIIGSGVQATTIQLAPSAVSSGLRYAIGNDETVPADFVDGWEISDLTIDANATAQGSASAAGGIGIAGKNLFIHRVEVKNFGSNTSGPVSYGINIPRSNSSNFAIPFNCIIDQCKVFNVFFPATGGSAVILVQLSAAAGAPAHQSTILRRCILDSGSTNLAKDVRAIAAAGATGGIIEQNQIFNCQYGGPYQVQTGSATELINKDLIIRDNYYYNVVYGLYQQVTNQTAGRFLFLKNWLELALQSGTYGVQFDGSSSTSPYRFTQLVARGNTIVLKDSTTPTSTYSPYAIRANSVQKLTVEQNIADLYDPNRALSHGACQYVSVLNNRSPQGVFYPGYNEVSPFTHDAEVTSDVEAALLGL